MTMPKTTWEQWGQEQEWLTRSGETKHLHGQAMFARSNVPPLYIYGPWPEWPDPLITPALPDTTTCLFDVYRNTLTYIETYVQQPDIAPNSGISIFQVLPRAAEHKWERDATRIISSRTPWPTTPCDNTIIADLAWTPRQDVEVRYFIRAWTEQFFRHVGPAYTIPDIPRDTCPFTEEQWAALVDPGTPCHGMVQTYRVANYFPGITQPCPACTASGDPVWNGDLTAFPGNPCRWRDAPEIRTHSVMDKGLYLAMVRLDPGAPSKWILGIHCTHPLGELDMWFGYKFTGQTPAGSYDLDSSACPQDQPETLTIVPGT